MRSSEAFAHRLERYRLLKRKEAEPVDVCTLHQVRRWAPLLDGSTANWAVHVALPLVALLTEVGPETLSNGGFYPLIARAVERLPEQSPERRRSIYERARSALMDQLRALDPPCSRRRRPA